MVMPIADKRMVVMQMVVINIIIMFERLSTIKLPKNRQLDKIIH